MRRIYPFLLKREKSLWSSLILYLFLSLIPVSFATGQACPDPGGGFRFITLTSTAEQGNYYPGSIPSGSTGTDRSTAGYLTTEASLGTVHNTRVYTIIPELPGKPTGSVVLKFDKLAIDAPDVEIRIYNAADASGVPALIVNPATAAGYLGTTVVFNGPVTVSFVSPTAGGSGNFDVYIKYLTGDQVFTSCQGQEVAVWTDFMQPDSYTFVDDYGDPMGGNSAPICVGYFDHNRQFVSSELSLCLDSDRAVASVMWWFYPGQVQFTFDANENHDIDRKNGYNADDQLKTARIMWILANAPMTTKAEQLAAQTGVWRTLEHPVDYTHTNAVAAQAKSAVFSLPVPAEPDFSVTAPSSTSLPGTPLNFTVNFNITGGHPAALKLVVPAGVTIGTVTGNGTYDAGTGILTFTSLPAVVTVPVTSGTEQRATLTAIYENEDFWNVNNLVVYNACVADPDQLVQDFVGLSRRDIVRPFREASGTWITPAALNCTNDFFQVEANRLYTIDASGNRTLVAALSGDLNAIGYNVGDHFLWGYDAAADQVFRLGGNGSIERFTIPDLPVSDLNVGTVDLNGYLYLYEKNGTAYFTIDINPARTGTYLRLVNPAGGYVLKTAAPWGTAISARAISDWVYKPDEGLLYSILDGSAGSPFQIVQINPVTGASTVLTGQVTGDGIQNTGNQSFGSQLFDNNGNLIVFGNNTGYWYSINIATKAATRISTVSIPNGSNDGAACPLINSPLAFDCSSDQYYQVSQGGTDKGLYSYNIAGARTLIAELTGDLNAITYNVKDNLIWGYDQETEQLFRLGSNGVINRFTIPNLTPMVMGYQFNVGTSDLDGHLYLYEKNGTRYFTVDIDFSRPTYLKLVDPANAFAEKTGSPWHGTTTARTISDWAYNPVDHFIYSIVDSDGGSAFNLLRFNPLNGNFDLIPGGPVIGGGIQNGGSFQAFGSSFFDKDGNFLVFGNQTGHLYSVNIDTKAAIRITTVSTPTNNNDGAYCPLASYPPLPVTLVSFDLFAENETVHLNWVTTTEQNSKAFEIERSTDAKNWIRLAEVVAMGESSDERTYIYTDHSPKSGINYYRLKMVDKDETFVYSNIRSVRLDVKADVTLYPNPVADRLFLKNVSGGKVTRILVHDLMGRTLTDARSIPDEGLDVSALPAGLYMIEIRMEDSTHIMTRILLED